ncbi:hypothetical protein HZA96_01035 [Candidatus Woesearchaeota archaeon]|nr:hypothetical protein [Candidatus Woesearchaeota archaeon]
MGEKSDKYLIKNVWYIMPGFIVTIPLSILILKMFNINVFNFFPSLLIFITLISFIIGYFIHELYRLIYHKFLLEDRELIRFFKRFLKKREFFGEKSNYIFSGYYVELIYNLLIYSNKDYSEKIYKFKKLSVKCSSLLTFVISLIIGSLLFTLIFKSYYYGLITISSKESLFLSFLIIIYLLLAIVLFWSYCYHFKLLNDHEITFLRYLFNNDSNILNIRANLMKCKNQREKKETVEIVTRELKIQKIKEGK